jgi:glycosyltransferase involved in cell wall biosynthesis
VTRALLYATFNGVANCTNGIGRQTQTLLGALGHRWTELTARTGLFTPYLAIPAPGSRTWAYDPNRLAACEQLIGARGGRIIPLAHDTDAAFWSPRVWGQLSAGAARAASVLTRRHDQVAVIAVDTPFVGTGAAHLALRHRRADRVKILLTLYGTAHINNHPHPWSARLEWEHAGLAAARYPGVHVADIGDFLTRHLIDTYGVDPYRFVTWRSSLDLAADDLQPMPTGQAASVAAVHGVRLDRPIILTVGRTDPVKGIDQLIDHLAPLRDQIHLVAVVVPFDGHDPVIAEYQRRISAVGVRATLLPRFSRDLPRALASLPTTRVVACPARGETLANVPFEVALWARHAGPIVLAPDRDGFREQIGDGVNGLLYDPGRSGALTAGIRRALRLGDDDLSRMRQEAHRRVAAGRDVVPNLAETLGRLFPHTPQPVEYAPTCPRRAGTRMPRSQATHSNVLPGGSPS